MDIKELQRNWDELGKRDAFGNIITDPAMSGKWQKGEFFKSGEEEIASLMAYIESLGLAVPNGTALDFGCGVGRLTQSLCRHFEVCHGIDIAPSMIAHAKRYNRFGERCRYSLNATDDLRIFQNNHFNLVYSNIVLQHMKPEYSSRYIGEFLRVLRPGGLIIFQLPSERVGGVKVMQNDGGSGRLPDSGFRAKISILDRPTSMNSCSRGQIRVRVKNVSESTWPASGEPDGRFKINLGNHWKHRNGTVIVNDDGRVGLPADLAAGEDVELVLTVSCPARPGVLLLELDIVQEGVAWFGDKGSATATVEVKVNHGISSVRWVLGRLLGGIGSLFPSKTFCPRMEMYGIAKSEVIKLIEKSGGKIVDVIEYNVSGDEWLSYRYCVTKE
jgi:SAM-dependent methyltransferase